MSLSIIIVNFNSGDLLKSCLLSLKEKLHGLNPEVCIVDNASTDSSLTLALSVPMSDIRVLRNTQNLGFGTAINQGIKATHGEFVLWLNPDAFLISPNFKKLTDYFDLHPEVGILGPKILNPDGSLQLSCRAFPSYQTAFFNRYSLLTRLFPQNRFTREYLKTDSDHSEIKEADWVSGAVLLHRRKVWDKLHGLDETFFMYCEDVDFCLRALKAGWKTVYHPEVVFGHHIGKSSAQLPGKMILERHKSIWHYYQKNISQNFFLKIVTGTAIFIRYLFLRFLAFLKTPA